MPFSLGGQKKGKWEAEDRQVGGKDRFGEVSRIYSLPAVPLDDCSPDCSVMGGAESQVPTEQSQSASEIFLSQRDFFFQYFSFHVQMLLL